ncbi:MAG: hypothetical protein ACLQVJ_07840 [Syntrophobacteraceae bacterium]
MIKSSRGGGRRDLNFRDLESAAREFGLPVVVKGLLTQENAGECLAGGATRFRGSMDVRDRG